MFFVKKLPKLLLNAISPDENSNEFQIPTALSFSRWLMRCICAKCVLYCLLNNLWCYAFAHSHLWKCYSNKAKHTCTIQFGLTERWKWVLKSVFISGIRFVCICFLLLFDYSLEFFFLVFSNKVFCCHASAQCAAPIRTNHSKWLSLHFYLWMWMQTSKYEFIARIMKYDEMK